MTNTFRDRLQQLVIEQAAAVAAPAAPPAKRSARPKQLSLFGEPRRDREGKIDALCIGCGRPLGRRHRDRLCRACVRLAELARRCGPGEPARSCAAGCGRDADLFAYCEPCDRAAGYLGAGGPDGVMAWAGGET